MGGVFHTLKRGVVRESQPLPPTLYPGLLPTGMTSFPLEPLGFPLMKPINRPAYSQCLVLMPAQTRPAHMSLLSTHHVPRNLPMIEESKAGPVPGIVQGSRMDNKQVTKSTC